MPNTYMTSPISSNDIDIMNYSTTHNYADPYTLFLYVYTK